jgi:hypothetical protein
MGPGTLRMALIDHLYLMDADTVRAFTRIETLAV